MPEFRRALLTLFALAAFLAAPTTAMAGEDLILATAEETETTEAPVNDSGITPAVEADAGSGEEAEQPWTARFLAPLVLTLGIVGLVVSLVAYVVRIWGRYRVAQ